MNTTTKIALAAALVLGAASAARANDIETSPSEAQATREWNEYLGHSQKHMGNGATSYGYFGSAVQQDDGQSGKRGRNR